MNRRRWAFGVVALTGLVALVAPAVGGVNVRSASHTADGGDGMSAKFRVAGRSSAVTTRDVYWADLPQGAGDGNVSEIPVGGGGVTTLASGLNDPVSVTVDRTHVYWVDGYDGTVNDVPLRGGSVTTLASGLNDPVSVAVDSTHVYWANLTDGTVNEVPLGGGTVTTLAAGQNGPVSVAVQGGYVYWLNEGAVRMRGTVDKVPVGGGQVITLATGQNFPVSVAVGP